MSGFIREFEARSVKYSVSESKVYVLDHYGTPLTFNYTISCDASAHSQVSPSAKILFFFNLQTNMCLVILPGGIFSELKYQCFMLRFFLENDLPVLSVNLFTDVNELMERIKNEFTEKYAAFLLDGIINED